ncbi:hypothetical protein DFH09DRAFT_1085450 [Mycena vulgaris]|nr:hypothetical protein DFH09DRAFT_1085450 [Mycena vulgaris]
MEDGDSIDVRFDQVGGMPVIYLYAPIEIEASVLLTLVPGSTSAELGAPPAKGEPRRHPSAAAVRACGKAVGGRKEAQVSVNYRRDGAARAFDDLVGVVQIFCEHADDASADAMIAERVREGRYYVGAVMQAQQTVGTLLLSGRLIRRRAHSSMTPPRRVPPRDVVSGACDQNIYTPPLTLDPIDRALEEASLPIENVRPGADGASPFFLSLRPILTLARTGAAPGLLRAIDLVVHAHTKAGAWGWVKYCGRLHGELGKGRKAIVLVRRARAMASLPRVGAPPSPTPGRSTTSATGTGTGLEGALRLSPKRVRIEVRRIPRSMYNPLTDDATRVAPAPPAAFHGLLLSVGAGASALLGWDSLALRGTRFPALVAPDAHPSNQPFDTDILRIFPYIAPHLDVKVDDSRITHEGNILCYGDTPGNLGVEDGDTPVIYLYSPAEKEVSVVLTLTTEWSFSAVYPILPVKLLPSGAGERIHWNVRTQAYGSLTELNTGLDVTYLFWEAITNHHAPMSPPASPVVSPANAMTSKQSITDYNSNTLLARHYCTITAGSEPTQSLCTNCDTNPNIFA